MGARSLAARGCRRAAGPSSVPAAPRYGRAVQADREPAAVPATTDRASQPAAARGVPAIGGGGGLADRLARASLARPALRAGTLASLQRCAGNRAVARAAAGRRLARYEAREHALFGGPGRTLKVGGADITEAELQAMGDFYKSPEAMVADAAANRGKFEKLRDEIRSDRTLREQGKDGRPEQAWISATAHRPKGETYLDLASVNLAHFAPGKGAEDHRKAFVALHRRALDAAKAAGKVTDEAAMLNAFGGHFLTDAFAAGHLVNKREVMDTAGQKFDAMSTTGTLIKENDFSKKLAKGLLANATVAKELANWELKVVAWGAFTPERLSEVIYGMRGEAPDSFLSLFARVVHDQLDDAIKAGKDQGLEVTNDNGDVWTLSGDETLRLSPETQMIAGWAVEASRRNLEQAAAEKGALDYDAYVANAWRFAPRPTTQQQHADALKRAAEATSSSHVLQPAAGAGRDQLNDVVATYTNPADDKTINAVIDLAVSKFDAVLDQLQEKQVARRKVASPPARQPAMDPGKI